MDFKIKKMKSAIVIIVLSCLLSSCATHKRDKFDYHFGEFENEWINMYKTDFFLSCIRKGYQDDEIFKLMAKKDLLVPYEPILFHYDEIDSLAANVIKNMPKPIFPHCDDCTVEEEAADLKKNYICASCLNYYASRELDVIAKRAYKGSTKGKLTKTNASSKK